jgi:TetR/AcrR family transcriptional repressor of nem operon
MAPATDRSRLMPRPSNLDRREILDRAMHEFWSRGFRASSVDTLVREIGTTRFSLYQEFGGKAGLFEAALDHYAENVVTEVLRPMTDPSTGIAGIQKYFDDIITRADRDDRLARGCLMTNTMTEVGASNRRIRKRTQAHFDRVARTFERALSRARERGELGDADGDLAVASIGLATFAQGVWACARGGVDARSLRRSVRAMIGRLRA